MKTLKISLWENVIITRPTFCYAWSFFECWIWGKIIKNKVLTRNDFSFKYIDFGEFMPISWKWTDLRNCLGALISWSSYRIKSDQGMSRNYFQSGLTGGWDTLKPSQNNNELGKNLSWVEANSSEIRFLYNSFITKVDITFIITVMVKIFGKLKAMKFSSSMNSKILLSTQSNKQEATVKAWTKADRPVVRLESSTIARVFSL